MRYWFSGNTLREFQNTRESREAEREMRRVRKIAWKREKRNRKARNIIWILERSCMKNRREIKEKEDIVRKFERRERNPNFSVKRALAYSMPSLTLKKKPFDSRLSRRMQILERTLRLWWKQWLSILESLWLPYLREFQGSFTL